MNDVRSASGDTSNDVLFRLEAMHLTDSMNYRIIAQSESEVRDIQNAPAISMSSFITESDQTKLLKNSKHLQPERRNQRSGATSLYE